MLAPVSNVFPLTRRVGWLAMLGGAAGVVLADAPPRSDLAQAPAASLRAYGERNPDCLEWTDSCGVCRRLGPSEPKAPEIACSTPGVACQPGDVMCRYARPKEQ
jgi:hypothetical protein